VPSPAPDFTVLLVCTGNICRSALAERLGRSYVEDALGKDARMVRLVSAGVGAVVGSAMHPHSALVLEGLGGNPTGFRARQLVDHMVMDADLILTMTRAHRERVLEVAPRALARTFTLREAADLVGLLGEDVGVTTDGLPARAREWVRELASARSRRQSSAADDVRDPIDLPLDVHQAAGDGIAEALIPVLARVVGPPRTAP
jgi:protein-tyrosine phosphatase